MFSGNRELEMTFSSRFIGILLSALCILSQSAPASAASSTDQYRLGSEWGKVKVTDEIMSRETWAFQRAALATARVGGGTGFYLGKFNGLHLVATNYHVCGSAWECLNQSARFPLLNLKLKMNKFLGSWSDVDLAILAISVKTDAEEQALEQIAGNFAFRAELYPGQELITIGFGVAGNSSGALMAGQDSDCKVFSGRNEFRKMNDPDALNPGDYASWSFANGCDVSHGDSGSAMVDRRTGDVVGIIWTGKIPKAGRVQDSSYLSDLLAHPDEAIWTELSYAVPAPKIAEKLGEVARATTNADLRATLLSLIGE